MSQKRRWLDKVNRVLATLVHVVRFDGPFQFDKLSVSSNVEVKLLELFILLDFPCLTYPGLQ